MNFTPDEHDLHAYVDGRLDRERAHCLEQWLKHHPEQAAQVRAWQQDAQALRAALAGELSELSETRDLDPAHLRRRKAQRWRVRLAVAASMLLGFAIGGAGGWQLHAVRQARVDPPMADAVQAYRLFVAAPDMHADIVQQQPGQIEAWLRRHFGNSVVLPDLGPDGFHPVSGRLLATAQGPAAMVLYHDAGGKAVSFYIRPPSRWRGRLSRGDRRVGGLIAQYGAQHGYNVAMVSRADSGDTGKIRAALDRSI